MPDITMCSGEGCPLKENCYRFTATPNPAVPIHSQSWFAEPPIQGDDCEYQIPLGAKSEGTP